MTHAAAIRVPVLVLQGDADNVVPPAQAAGGRRRRARRRRDGRAPRVRGRGPRLGASRRRDRRARARRRVPDPMGAAPMSADEYEYQGPKRGADRAVLLAHGAGADMHAKALTTVADALAEREDPVAAVPLPVQGGGQEGARPPAGARGRDARSRGRARALQPSSRPTGSCSAAARWAGASARSSPATRTTRSRRSGSLLLGYPLHPPGKPEKLRVEHFPRLTMPVAVRERHARLARGAGRAARARRRRSRGRSPSTGSRPPTTASGR